MALHCREDRNNMSWWNRIAFQLQNPLIVEGFVGSDEEGLLRRRCLSKSVGYVSTKYKEVLAGSDSIE